MQRGDSVRYRGRRFMVVLVTPDGWALLRDDEGEELRVRASACKPV